ncbi:hypothetical protein RR48_07455 [Papilio machaon]|uniref:Uncharacterized protein n=1 Tax=Papilio machaon TaxID=76193 RepID=A0A194RUN9_PAPMA|nr:hypothetical protein RR48_07455 [Papilio machaon]
MPPPHALPCGPYCGTGNCAPHCYHRNKIIVYPTPPQYPPIHYPPHYPHPPPQHHPYPPPPHHPHHPHHPPPHQHVPDHNLR